MNEVKPIVPTMVERKRGDIWEKVTFDMLCKGDVFWFFYAVYIAKSDAEPYGLEEECNYVIEVDYA